MAEDVEFDAQALAIVRRAFARQMLAVAGIGQDAALEDAFATVPRERFLGEPPWQMVPFFSGGYRALPSADPVLAYQDVNFGLAPARGVNNGSPSLHARWLSAAALRPGQRVAHIGAGTGYYTALLAHLVGDSGHVLAVEYDPVLAARAATNLSRYGNVRLAQGDGAVWPEEEVDCVYVNFAVARPAGAWLARLAPGGRLIFPLAVPGPPRKPGGGVHAAQGAGLRVERREAGFAAQWLGPAFFVFAEGPLAGSAQEHQILGAAFERGGMEFVRSLYWKQAVDPGRCWHVGQDWSLGYDEIP